MSSVFAITQGCYSDYRVVAVFSTRELAEAFLENARERYPDCVYDESIEEFPLDTPVELATWSVSMHKDGTVFHCFSTWQPVYKTQVSFLSSFRYGKAPLLSVTCSAKDEQHAVKIASEIRTRALAQGWWGKNDKTSQLATV